MNFSGEADWLEKQPRKMVLPIVEEVKEEYVGPDFKIGNIIKLKNKPDLGIGIIVKELNDYKYWVVLPDKENRISSFPWDYQIFNRTEMMLQN